MIIGILNTLQVAVIGIVLATILGTLIGIGRLSSNLLLAQLTAFYVETLRDIPLLLQLFFWYAILQTLPPPRPALAHRQRRVPVQPRRHGSRNWIWHPADTWALAAFVVGIVGTIAWNRTARRRQEATGRRPRIWPMALASLIALPAVVWVALGAPLRSRRARYCAASTSRAAAPSARNSSPCCSAW